MLENLSLGFGHFSNMDDEESWRTYSYDGLESTRGIDFSVFRTSNWHEIFERLTSLNGEENMRNDE